MGYHKDNGLSQRQCGSGCEVNRRRAQVKKTALLYTEPSFFMQLWQKAVGSTLYEFQLTEGVACCCTGSGISCTQGRGVGVGVGIAVVVVDDVGCAVSAFTVSGIKLATTKISVKKALITLSLRAS